jgi:hypothetical protein
MSAAMRGKSESARKQIRAQCCKKVNNGLRSALESATRAMRDAVHAFDAATEDQTPPLTDDQINALDLTAQGKLADALAAGSAAITAAHDKAIADLTAAGAPQAQLDAVNAQTDKARSCLQKASDYAGQKLAEMLAEALAANDVPTVPDPSGTGGGTEPTEPAEPPHP